MNMKKVWDSPKIETLDVAETLGGIVKRAGESFFSDDGSINLTGGSIFPQNK